MTQDFGFVTLDIASCVAEDSGMYMVKAVNLSGEASSSFAVHVGGRSGVMEEALHPDSYKKIQALVSLFFFLNKWKWKGLLLERKPV